VTIEDEVLAVRRDVGLFALEDRGLIEVTGGDARRWLNGMVTNDVSRLEPGSPRSGCPALVLTNKGRVVADVQVLAVEAGFWLETARAAVPDLMERLSKFVIADDVRLVDRSDDVARIGLEGPGSGAVLDRALDTTLVLERDGCASVHLGAAAVVVARFGWSGEDARQLFVPSGSLETVSDRLLSSAMKSIPDCSAEALEVLRIEAGRPRLFAELSSEILPPEARLEGTISYTKGCYTGQEIVARLRSRGHVNHLLVGLRLASGELPPRGAVVCAGDREIGEITSAVRSPKAGAIALAFVRVGHDEPGATLVVDGKPAQVSALPFVTASEPSH
jgi:folate-binding protein YgfZ